MADIDNIINILRRATVVVKVAPFGFVIMHLVSMLVYMFTNDYASSICDMLFYISPMVVFYNLILSRVFKLCKWHRLECRLPLFPLIAVFINDFIYPLSAIALWLNWSLVVIMITLSLINAYFVFLKD